MDESGQLFFDDSKIKIESPKRIDVDVSKKIIEINKKPWWKFW
jgi:hypothetical protein